MPEVPSSLLYGFLRGIVRFLVGGFLAGGLFRVRGTQDVPRHGALLVCSNHQSTLEPPAIAAYLPRSDSWNMAKSEFFRAGALKRWFFVSYHCFPVIRNSPDRAALRRSTEILKSGQVLIIYPEGTRVPEGGLIRPEPGAGWLATVTGAPVQPVALNGGRDAFPKGSKFPRRARVEIVFGRPFTIPSRHPDGSRVSHADAADTIMWAIAELLSPALRGEYSDLEALRARLGHLREQL